MKLTIERASLLKSLAHVQSVVERRNTIPILSNVLLEAGSENLRLSATDMDLSVVEGVSADVEQTGATTAPAHTLYDIVRKLPEGAEVSFEVAGDNGRMTLAAGRSNFALTTLPKEDFPAVGDGVLPQSFAMAAGKSSSSVAGRLETTVKGVGGYEPRRRLIHPCTSPGKL